MTDQSVPVGDRDEPPAVTGAALARQALNQAPATFAAQVVDAATLRGWLVHFGPPTYLLVKRGRLIVAHVGPVTGYKVDELFARLRSVPTVACHHFRPADGLGPVVAALGDRPPSLTARHVAHYRSCGCLDDSATCCDRSCCPDALGGEGS